MSMPYASNADLRPSLREQLPEHAQDIYRAAFNNAWDEYASRSDREAVAHRVAWTAVKRHYRKLGGRWVPRAP
jgi:cation transport regulator